MIDTSLTYLVESLPWAIGGFLAGVLSMRVIRRQNILQEASMPPGPERPRPRLTVLHVIGLVLIVLTFASALQAWAAQQSSRRLTQCLVTYANSIADAIEIRSKATSEAQQTQDAMWRTLLQVAPTDEGRAHARQIFQEYLDKRAEVAKAQQANPYPPPPRDVCPESR